MNPDKTVPPPARQAAPPPQALPWREGLEAARVNLLPAMILWVVASLVVGVYYFAPPARPAYNAVLMLREELGLVFPVLSTALFGGILPLLFQRLSKVRDGAAWGDLPFFAGFWALKGLEINLIYWAQAAIFGDSNAPVTVTLKVLADQFIYTPLWAAPTMVLGYLWKNSGFSARAALAKLGQGWYRRRVLPVLLCNWVIWIPTVTLIYTLPLALQLPLQNIVLCLFALFVLFLTREPAGQAQAG